MQITGKVFAITGAGNGIGREVALGIARKGGHVAALDLSDSGVMTDEEVQKLMSAAGDKARKTTAPAEAGRQIIEAIEKGSYEIFIGQDARFMSRLSRLNPKKAAGLIYSQMKDLLG